MRNGKEGHHPAGWLKPTGCREGARSAGTRLGRGGPVPPTSAGAVSNPKAPNL